MKKEENIFEKYAFNETDTHYTIERFRIENLKANSYFLRFGEIANRVCFVKKGLLRSFIYDDHGEEVTTQFFQQGTLIIPFDSFNNQVPSKENIVAITDAELLSIDYYAMKELYQKIPLWSQICKDISDRKSNEMINRSVQFQTMTATERYLDFCAENPDVIKYASLSCIASYLGMDIATLSRIRKKK